MYVKKLLVTILSVSFVFFSFASYASVVKASVVPPQVDQLNVDLERTESVIGISARVSHIAKASDGSGNSVLSVANRLSIVSSAGKAKYERTESDDVVMWLPGKLLPQVVKYVNIVFSENYTENYTSYIDFLRFEGITDAQGSIRIDAYSIEDDRWIKRSSDEMETAINDTAPLVTELDLQGNDRIRFDVFFHISKDSSTYLKKDLEFSRIVVVDLGENQGGYITVTIAYFIAGITIVAVILLIAFISNRFREKKKRESAIE